MIKESYSLIGQKHISIYNLKLCEEIEEKSLLLRSKLINLSFCIIFNLTIPPNLVD